MGHRKAWNQGERCAISTLREHRTARAAHGPIPWHPRARALVWLSFEAHVTRDAARVSRATVLPPKTAHCGALDI